MFHVEPNSQKKRLASPKDALVSGESFELLLDLDAQIAKTHPFPDENKLPSYYQHEDYISHGNARQSFVEKVYGIVQEIMFAKKHSWMQAFLEKESSYLDYGCGTGSLVNHLKRKGVDAHGVEPNEKARNHHQETDTVVKDLASLKKKTFGVVALWHVLEHIPAPEELLGELQTMLSDEGVLIIAVPNFKSRDAEKYKDHWAAYDVPRHLWHFSKQGLVSLVKKQGLECTKIRPLWFDAFYVSYLSEKHKGRSLPLIRGLIFGLYSNLHALRTGEYSSLVYFFQKQN